MSHIDDQDTFVWRFMSFSLFLNASLCYNWKWSVLVLSRSRNCSEMMGFCSSPSIVFLFGYLTGSYFMDMRTAELYDIGVHLLLQLICDEILKNLRSSLMFRLLWLYLTGENYSKQLSHSPLCWVRKNIYIITHTLDFTANGLFCILNAFLLPSITV